MGIKWAGVFFMVLVFFSINMAIFVEYTNIGSEYDTIRLESFDAQNVFLGCVNNHPAQFDGCKKDLDDRVSSLRERLNNVNDRMETADNRFYNYWNWFN